MIISCIIIAAVCYCKRNRKYDVVDDVEGMDDEEGMLPATMTTMSITTSNGEHSYHSDDEENNDVEMASPEKDTDGAALDALIGDGNDNYTRH